VKKKNGGERSTSIKHGDVTAGDISLPLRRKNISSSISIGGGEMAAMAAISSNIKQATRRSGSSNSVGDKNQNRSDKEKKSKENQ